MGTEKMTVLDETQELSAVRRVGCREVWIEISTSFFKVGKKYPKKVIDKWVDTNYYMK